MYIWKVPLFGMQTVKVQNINLRAMDTNSGKATVSKVLRHF